MLRQITVLLGLSAGLLAGTAANAAEAGKLVFVSGQVMLGGSIAKQDSAVQEGDELSTGADGYVYVKTVDNGFLILRPNSKARITAYHIDSAQPGNTRVKLEVLSGVARSISGQGVKQARQHFRFNTPVAAIGVRGTDFIVYTDQQTSRVQVVSGGIVMSGFAGPCGPEGSGPCEGSASRELFAGQDGVLLQLRRGEHAPQLLRGTPALAPDQAAPPRPDEPVGKPTAAVSPAIVLSVAELPPNLEAQKASVLGSGKPVVQGLPDSGSSIKPPAEVATNPTPPVVVVPDPVPAQPTPVTPPVTPDPVPTPEPAKPPVVVVPVEPAAPAVPTVPVGPTAPIVPAVPTVPAVPAVPEVMWGRWKAIAGMPGDKEFTAKLSGGEYGTALSVGGAYQIGRVKNTEFVMPREGTASFALTASEVSLQLTGQEARQAAVKDAQLTINFATRRFDTGMTVYTADNSLSVTGKGDITLSGSIVSDLSTYTNIRGFLGGANAGEAAYVFRAVGNPKMIAEGALSWRR